MHYFIDRSTDTASKYNIFYILLHEIAPEESRDWLLDDNIQQQLCIFTKQHQIDLGKTYVAATDLF